MRNKVTHYHQRDRRKARIYSAGIHLLFLLLAIFGLPSFMRPVPPEEPVAISVEILPITGITNVKPSESSAPEEKPEPKQAEQKKAAPPVQTAEPAPPPPPPEPKPAEKPKEKEKPKPEEKPKEAKKEEPKKPKQDDFAAVLKAVKDTAQKQAKQESKENSKTNDSKTKAVSNQYNPTLPMSMSERDAIMSQIAKCWSLPAGAKDAQNLVPLVDAEYNVDGTLINAVLADESKARYNSDNFFRAAADAAIRAVKQCSPLKGLPPEKYETWRSMELRFDPKFMLN